MENKNENMTNELNDRQLKDVAGGSAKNILIGVHTSSKLKYTGGDTPKYSVGQELKIEAGADHVRIPCEVLSVSETKTGGWIYKEYVYSVKILPFEYTPRPDFNILIGEVYKDVYESCLFES